MGSRKRSKVKWKRGRWGVGEVREEFERRVREEDMRERRGTSEGKEGKAKRGDWT